MSTMECAWNSPPFAPPTGVARAAYDDELFATDNTGTRDWLPNRIEQQANGFYAYIISPSPTAPEDPEERFDALLAATSTQALRAALRNDD